jgi:hypothetical protein
MLHGTVKFFNEEKKYGFLVPDEGGPDVYFELGRRREVKVKGEAVILGDHAPKGAKLADPKQGTRLVYKEAIGSKGPWAKSWAHLTPYQIAQGTVDKMPLLRVVKEVTLSRDAAPTSETVWQGKVASVAKREFPALGKGLQVEDLHGTPIGVEYRLEKLVDDNWTNESIVIKRTRSKPKRRRSKNKSKKAKVAA